MVRKDGRNVLRTPSLAETVMQPENFPYTRQDLELMREGKDYQPAKQFWPTPDASQRGARSLDLVVDKKTVRRRKSGQQRGMDLQMAVKLWPTPTATERSGINPKTGRGAGLSKAVKLAGKEEKAKLNPDWVEQLMGFPLGWTDLDKQNIELTNRFPRAWLDGSWEEEIPRTTTRSEGRAATLL